MPPPISAPEEDSDQQGGAEHAAREAESQAEDGDRQLGDEDQHQLAEPESAFDGRETQSLRADAEHVGQLERDHAQRQPREHRS